MPDEAAPSGRQLAVVVVHGVGGAQPGWELNEIVDSLQARFNDEFRADAHFEVHPLASPPAVEGGSADKFQAHVRSATLTRTGDRVRFYDLHWADLTHAPPGRFNAFLGSFRIIFESHHFIDAILPRDAGPLSRQLRRQLIWAAAILRGPIVGTSACLVAVGLALYVGYEWLSLWAPWLLPGHGRARELATVWLVNGTMAVLLVAALYLFYRRAQSRETEWNDVFVAVVFGAVFVGAYTWLLYAFPESAFLRGKNKPNTEMCIYVERFYYVTQSIRIVWYLFLISAFALVAALFLLAPISRNEVRPGAALAATGIVVMQSALWLTVLSAFAVPIIRQADLHQMATCGLENLYVSFAGTAALLGGVGWCILLTYLVRKWLARLPLVSDERRAKLVPRLLFGGLITLAIFTGAMLQGAIFVASYLAAFVDNNVVFDVLRSRLTGVPVVPFLGLDVPGFFELAERNRRWFYAPIGVLAVGVSLLISSGATTGIQIARDLIDHHYSPRLGYSYHLLPKRRQAGPRTPRRQRIHDRLDTLVREVICKQPFDALLFVTHSQGSVIVYDYLRYGGPECQRLLSVRPHVVTFGSPLGHIYQFYFREYSDLNRVMDSLRPSLSSWTNLFRVDDYVGREIRTADSGFVSNKVMRAGGHIDYWRDTEVGKIILDRLRAPRAA